MPEATITITGTYLNPDDTAASGSVSFQPADVRDITNAKIAMQETVSVPLTGGTFTKILLAVPGGYKVTENITGATAVSYNIGGTSSIDLSSVNAGTATFDASGIGVLVIEDIPGGATYTTVLADVSKQKRATSATAQTVRFDGSLGYPIGASGEFLQWGAGRLTFSGINGAVLRQADSALITRKQYSGVFWEKITNTEFWLQGDLATS